MFRLYDFAIALLAFGMKLAAGFSAKVKKGVEGRKNALAQVQQGFRSNDRVIWMHAASLGEYEQGLPVLERLKAEYPQCKVLVTFFSPSGYEIAIKKKAIADVVTYLPFDKKKEVQAFCQAFQPVLFFTVKYDYWYRLLEALNQKQVPIYVVSALFYPQQNFFKPWGSFFVKQLNKRVNLFFHQTPQSLALAKSIGLSQGMLSGDTRFDRVKQIVANFSEIEKVQSFVGENKILVVGSSWEAEEKIVADFVNRNSEVKVILAPHDLKRVPQIAKQFGNKAFLYSGLREGQPEAQILIIDNIGMLSRLYHYGDVALVGGGFHSAGLHNILEAAVYGIPILFGNHYRKNPEADGLIAAEGARSFSEESQAVHFLQHLFDQDELRNEMALKSKYFIEKQPHATEVVVANIDLKKGF